PQWQSPEKVHHHYPRRRGIRRREVIRAHRSILPGSLTCRQTQQVNGASYLGQTAAKTVLRYFRYLHLPLHVPQKNRLAVADWDRGGVEVVALMVVEGVE
ncbi:hypothetical protein BaRGS_00019331, partial [Batillaria attramentaria]